MGFGGGGGGGGYIPPAPTPEKPQTSKPVTEAATAARQSQKDKASKAAGLKGSILTDPMAGGGQNTGKSLLGQ